jgi:hypothetical protein
MMFTHRHPRGKLPTIVDRRVEMSPNLTYGLLIGCVPTYRYQDIEFSIDAAWVRQVAHYLVWPISQSHIIWMSERRTGA